MGSVRRSSWRRYLPYIGLNVVVSAITMLVVLAAWGKGSPAPESTPTSTMDVAARVASALPPPSATSPPTPAPVTYQVIRGDTFYSIARKFNITVDALMAANGSVDPQMLMPGMSLVIPGVSPTSTSAPQATGQPGGGQAPQVEIRGVDGMGNLQDEAVRLLNTGGVAAMAGWTLDDGENHVYSFPEFTLHSGAVSVHTKTGTDTVIDLYWGLEEAIWAPGKVITLRDAAGNVLSTFSIP